MLTWIRYVSPSYPISSRTCPVVALPPTARPNKSFLCPHFQHTQNVWQTVGSKLLTCFVYCLVKRSGPDIERIVPSGWLICSSDKLYQDQGTNFSHSPQPAIVKTLAHAGWLPWPPCSNQCIEAHLLYELYPVWTHIAHHFGGPALSKCSCS